MLFTTNYLNFIKLSIPPLRKFVNSQFKFCLYLAKFRDGVEQLNIGGFYSHRLILLSANRIPRG